MLFMRLYAKRRSKRGYPSIDDLKAGKKAIIKVVGFPDCREQTRRGVRARSLRLPARTSGSTRQQVLIPGDSLAHAHARVGLSGIRSLKMSAKPLGIRPLSAYPGVWKLCAWIAA
jgi:hypothetical protein